MKAVLARAAASWARTVQATVFVIAVAQAAAAGPIEGTPPYPQSTYLTEMTLDWSTFRRDGLGSDNWVTTWAANDYLYTSWGDGGGFGENAAKEAYVSIGLARLTGNSAGSLRGENLIGGLAPSLAPCFPVHSGALADGRSIRAGVVQPCHDIGLHGKSFSMLALDDRLYKMISRGYGPEVMDEARLYRVPIESNNWQRADWAFTKNPPYPLVTPVFMQAGKNYGDGGDYIYAYAARYAPTDAKRGKIWIHRGPDGGEIVLLRAARTNDLMQRTSWEFFAGLKDNLPTWASEAVDSEPVFRDPRGVGFASTSIYVKPLNRYLLVTFHDTPYSGNLGVFEAAEPWGPWRTVLYGSLANWMKGVAATAFVANFMANSFSSDGRAFTFIFTGKDSNDALNVLDGRFTISQTDQQGGVSPN